MAASTDNDRLGRIEQKLDILTTDIERSNDKFDNYQRATTQWVVQLAFTLIVSATITVILSTVLQK
ncbi:MAG: hypothetical protein AAGB19_12740 [Cyanobacteria bacterium P01_F01_bin.3]